MFNINTNIIPEGGRVLVALSGGADSVCLTHYLARNALKLDITVAAAHYIHGIRPEDAEKELELVRSLCRDLGIELFVGRGDVPAYAEEKRLGLEEAARELRYAFLRKPAGDRGFGLIATAHNRGDQAETVIFNMIRGSGLSGLSGIAEKRSGLIRPLLGVPRCDIEDYCRRHGLSYATDPTNADVNYSRNMIRHEVMPRLRGISSRAEEAIAAAAEASALADDFIAAQAALLVHGNDIARSELLAAHPALHHYILSLLLDRAGGEGRSLTRRHDEAILSLAASDRASGSIDAGRGFAAVVSYGRLFFEKKGEESCDGETVLRCGEPVVWNGWEIELGADEGRAFNKAGLEGPIIVRSRREGDRISMPYGSKNIKKLLIDKKIPIKSRDRIPLICDNRGVLLIGGLADAYDRLAHSGQDIIKIKCRRIQK